MSINYVHKKYHNKVVIYFIFYFCFRLFIRKNDINMAIQDHMKNLPSLVEVDAEAVSEVEDMVVYMMQKMIYKNPALIEYDQKYQEAELASSQQLIACIYVANNKLMPLVDVVQLKHDRAVNIRGRVVNQESTHVSVQQMIENFSIMSSFL